MRVCKLEASRARPSPPFLDPAIFAPLPQPALDPATLPGFSRGVSPTHVRKSCGQEVRGAGPAGRPDPGEAERSPSRAPQPQPNSRLCLVVVHALPQHTQARGTERLGCGWRPLGPGPGGDEQRGLAAEAGGCGRLGRVGGQEKGARRPPRDPGVWEESDGNSEPPLGLHSASKLGASARAQPGSQGPEGGRGQGCATGEGDAGTLIC